MLYVNDAAGAWDGDAPGHIARALAGKGGAVLREVMPQSGDVVLFKPNGRISLAYLEHVTGSFIRDTDDWILGS